MEKKDLKFYEAPELEVLDMEIEGSLLDASKIDGVDNLDDLNGGNDDPGF